MRRLLPLLLLFTPTPATAQLLAYAALDANEEVASGPSLPYAAVAPDEEPADPTRRWPRWALLDRFEYAVQKGGDGYSWDFSALLGGARNRLWIGSVGEGAAWAAPDYLEFHALYSRNVGGPWDVNGGLRWDPRPRPSRLHGVLGAQYDDGEALWIGAWAYLSTKGEASARLAGYYNLALTDRLYLQPSAEIDAYGEDVPELGIGHGFSYAEAGLRLRWEFLEGKLAPYVGLSWSRDLGRTARMTRESGDDPETKALVLGIRSGI